MSTPNVVLAKKLYTAHATAIGGREGRTKSDDGNLDLAIVPPRELGGKGDVQGTNPEQLFAAGYAACFGSAMAHVARLKKIVTGPLAITAHVALGQAGQGFGLAVELVADVPEMPREEAQALLEAAHAVCPYSNATRGNIAVDIRLA